MADGLMANPYAGLLNLGLSPEQAQAEVDRQRAIQFANLNPQQRMAAGIYGGLTQVSRALGAKDPMLEQASQMRQMAQQFDTTTAQGLMQYAQALQQSGNVPAAQAAAMQARQMLEQEAKVGKLQAETGEVQRKGTAASEAAKSRAKALQRQFPNMSEEEAVGYAEDPRIVYEMLRVPKEVAKKTKTVNVNGRVVLIDETTGETIKDLGAMGKTPEQLTAEAFARGIGAANAKPPKEPTPLSTADIKEITRLQGVLGTSEAVGKDATNFINLIDEGKLNFSVVEDAKREYRARFGKPTESDLNRVKFEQFTTGAVNAILNAAKGTQTEGDAQRARDQIVSGFAKNDKNLVKAGLEGLRDAQTRLAEETKSSLNLFNQERGGRVTPAKGKKTITLPSGAVVTVED